MTRPPIVLLGLDCRTGLQSARLFARRGIAVFGVAENLESPYCSTQAVRGCVAAASFRQDPERWLRPLAGQGTRPVLLPCTDSFVVWLDRNRDAVDGVAVSVMPPSEVLATLVEKSKLYRYAAQHGLPVPVTRFLTNRADAEAAATVLRFPVALKPSVHTRAWLTATGGRKVLRIEVPEELGRVFERYAVGAGEMVAQEWIAGSDAQMFSLYSYCTRRGQVAARLVVRKLRQWPPGIGVGSLAMQIEDRDIERLGLDLLLGLGYCGLSSVQVKKDAETGKASIIEVNAGRPALNMPIAEFCGVEMQMAYYCEAAGLPLPVQNGILRPGAKWICVKTDLAAAAWHWRHHNLGFGDWWRTVQGPKVHAVHSWRDPAPFFLDLLRKSHAMRWLPLPHRHGGDVRGSWRNS